MAAKPKGAPKNYTVLRSTLHFDGDAYAPGEDVSLVDADAEPLLLVGAIEAAAKPGKTTETKT